MLEGLTQEEVIALEPTGVRPEQWKPLVQYWFSKKFKSYSEKGKAARAAKTNPHTTGSKSFAQKREEFEVENKRKPGRIEFFGVTRKRKDGNFIDNESAEFVEKAKTLLAERTGTSEFSETTNNVEGEIFTELKGPEKYGRVRGYGIGVTPTQINEITTRPCCSGNRESNVELQMTQMKTQLEEMKREHQNEIYELRSEISTLTSALRLFFGHMGHPARSNSIPNSVQVPDASSRPEDNEAQRDTSQPGSYETT